MDTSLVTDVDRAIAAGAEHLFGRQRADGVFAFDSSAAATLATCGAITTLHLTDPARFAEPIASGVDWLRRTQNPDGGWPTIAGGPTESVTTAIAVATLKIVAGEDETVRTGLAAFTTLGGLAGIPDQTLAGVARLFHTLAGWQDESGQRRLPLAVLLFPAVRRRRISFRATPFIGMALAQAHRRPSGPLGRLVLRLAEPVALNLLAEVHRHEGGTGEFGADAWAAAMLGIGLARAGVGTDILAAITGWLTSSQNPDGSWEAVRIGLTWSGFAATGLVSAGYGTDPRLAATRTLFHDCQQTEPFRLFDTPPGGWSYSGPRGWPVTLESAELLAALAGFPDAAGDQHLRSGVDWLAGRQDSRGSWSLWVRDTQLPNDGPCPYLTCQAVEALLDAGWAADHVRIQRALRWLVTQQRPDGSFEALWYRDHTPGTAIVLGTLARCGLGNTTAAERARDWLRAAQLPDGSWGTGVAEVPGTVEETAWAVRALIHGGATTEDPAVRRGISWLLGAQQDGGSWPEAPVSNYIRFCAHYPNGAIAMGLALRALADYRAKVAA